jgi:hypothetical protein
MVPAGSIGRYWAPDYARTLGIGGPNVSAAPSTYFWSRAIEPDVESLQPNLARSVVPIHPRPPAIHRGVRPPIGDRPRWFEDASSATAASVRLGEWTLQAQEKPWDSGRGGFVFVLNGTVVLRAGGHVTAVSAGSVARIATGDDVTFWAPISARLLMIEAP